MVEPIEARFQRGLALHQQQKLEAAQRAYEEVLRDDPEHAGALHLLGVVHLARGDFFPAVELIERALKRCSTKAVYWNNYGAVLRELGRAEDAQRAFQEAVDLQPQYADAWANLGLVQLEQGRLAEAERALKYAQRLAPRHSDVLRHLARLYRDKGDLEEAMRLCRDAVAVAPAALESRLLSGELLAQSRRLDEAAAVYREALVVQPESAEAHVGLGMAFSDLDDVESAGREFATAAVLRADRPMWRLRELALCPVVFDSHEQLEEYRTNLEQRLDEALADPPAVDWRHVLRDGFTPSFNLSHHGVCNRQIKEKFARLFADSFPKERPRRGGSGKIRAGFLVTAGHEGGFWRGLGGIMERLDRRQFEVVGLASPAILATCWAAVRSADITWASFPHELPRALEAIQATRCDVILHWQAGTDILNYYLPFLPLAPVQCIGFGMHGTTGIAAIDFFVSSRLFERGHEAAADYAETLYQFEGATAWQPRLAVPGAASRADFGLPASGGLYFCPQRLAKFHPDFDRLLAQILDGDPAGNVLILKGRQPRSAAALKSRLERTLGQQLARRVRFLPAVPPTDYMRLLSLVDVVLDAPAYSASLTDYDALAMGVPVATLPGPLMVQRYALGLYRQMEMQDLVSGDEREYVELAVRLGREADFRNSLRQKILRRNGVLYEDDRVVREYEEFFRRAVAESPR